MRLLIMAFLPLPAFLSRLFFHKQFRALDIFDDNDFPGGNGSAVYVNRVPDESVGINGSHSMRLNRRQNDRFRSDIAVGVGRLFLLAQFARQRPRRSERSAGDHKEQDDLKP